MLKGLKMNYIEVRDALLKMDSSKLDADKLKAIAGALPLPDEVPSFPVLPRPRRLSSCLVDHHARQF